MWLAKISNEEHTFFFKLMTSQVVPQRDQMVKMTKALEKAEKEFEEKWKNRFKEDNKDPEWALESREQLKSILDSMR